MPGNLSIAAPAGVLPNSLCTAFVETRVFPVLSVTYHDGTIERSMIADGVNIPRPLRSWSLAKRLTETQRVDLQAFWETTTEGSLRTFYFYDPYDTSFGQAFGKNYDATGASTQGRVVVRFQGAWQHVLTVGRRSNIPNLTLQECA
jgi:hypothetical protein